MPVFLIGAFDLVAFAVAAICLILLLAGNKIFGVLSSLMRKVPAIGGAIADVIDSSLAGVISAIAPTYLKELGAVANFLWALPMGLWHYLYQLESSISDVYNAIQRTYLHADNNAQSVLNRAEALASGAASGLAGEIAALQSVITADITGVEAQIGAGVAAAEAVAAADADRVLNQALDAIATAEADAAAGVQAAEALAQALAGQVQSEAVTLFGQAEGAITVIQGQIQALPGQIEGTIPGIIDGIVPGIIAGAIPGILSQVIPRVQALEGEVTECLEPLCDTVTPQAPKLGQLGQFLNNLELLGIEAIIIALAAEAAHDPEAVVHDFTTVIDDVGSPILSGFRDLIGV